MDENRQAILLLSAQFSAPDKGVPTPLTTMEYGRFAAWLRQTGAQPRDLFYRFDALLQHWQDPKGKVTTERLQYLLGRGMAMGLAIEKWQSAGIWILTRSDREYPACLKKRLGEAAPAVLFGVGQKRLLNAGGLAVVGSRNIVDEDLMQTQLVAKQAASEGINLVSGGARGVDETAMLSALEVEGTALGILANDLFKSALAGKWRKYLKSGQLALVSPFYPEARFHVGHAMGRNKYVYCLSDHALVIHCEEGSGGSWAGATENLRKNWVPLFVKKQQNASGNSALIEQGAYIMDIPMNGAATDKDWLTQQVSFLARDKDTSVVQRDKNSVGRHLETSKEIDVTDLVSSYADFIKFVTTLLSQQEQIKFSELKILKKDLKDKQLKEWLDQSVQSGDLKRHGRSRTYSFGRLGAKQADLFSE